MYELDVMAEIQNEKEHEVDAQQMPMSSEGTVLAEGKRFTFDVVTTPTDPLR